MPWCFAVEGGRGEGGGLIERVEWVGIITNKERGVGSSRFD